MQVLISFLKNGLNLLENLIQEVARFYRKEHLAKDEFLVQKGKKCQKMGLITQGYLRFFSYADQKVVTHWIFVKDQLVTDVASFFLQQPAKWNIQALTDTTIFSLSQSNYHRLRTEIPEWDEYEKIFLVKLLSALENRIYTLLSMSTKDRYQYLFESDSNMFNELPLQYLASMLGMTPETLSRIRNKTNS